MLRRCRPNRLHVFEQGEHPPIPLPVRHFVCRSHSVTSSCAAVTFLFFPSHLTLQMPYTKLHLTSQMPYTKLHPISQKPAALRYPQIAFTGPAKKATATSVTKLHKTSSSGIVEFPTQPIQWPIATLLRILRKKELCNARNTGSASGLFPVGVWDSMSILCIPAVTFFAECIKYYKCSSLALRLAFCSANTLTGSWPQAESIHITVEQVGSTFDEVFPLVLAAIEQKVDWSESGRVFRCGVRLLVHIYTIGVWAITEKQAICEGDAEDAIELIGAAYFERYADDIENYRPTLCQLLIAANTVAAHSFNSAPGDNHIFARLTFVRYDRAMECTLVQLLKTLRELVCRIALCKPSFESNDPSMGVSRLYCCDEHPDGVGLIRRDLSVNTVTQHALGLSRQKLTARHAQLAVAEESLFADDEGDSTDDSEEDCELHISFKALAGIVEEDVALFDNQMDEFVAMTRKAALLRKRQKQTFSAVDSEVNEILKWQHDIEGLQHRAEALYNTADRYFTQSAKIGKIAEATTEKTEICGTA